MPHPVWPAWMARLEDELESALGLHALRWMGRRAGRRLGAELREAPPEDPRRPPFPATHQGLLPDPARSSRLLAEFCAGLLEGLDPEGGVRRVRPTAEGHTLTAGGPVQALPEAPDFHLPEDGPLSSYQIAQLVDLSEDAILFVDRERRFRAWNRGAERMFGYRAEEALGRYYDLVVPEDLRQAGELDEIHERSHQPGGLRNYRTRRVRKDGREILVSLTRTEVRNRQGQPVGFGVILRDVTEEERLRQELETARQLARVGELASQVAHEVRNPLAGIHGALQILRRRLRPQGEDLQVFEDIASEIERLDHIVTDLLRFGRPVQPDLRDLDLGAWLEDWRRRHEEEFRDRRIRVQVEAPPGLSVRADPLLLEQVLRNLAENAREAQEREECRLHLRARPGPGSPSRACLEVRDDGPGIPPEIRGRVLEPFFTTRSQGSGLGLAICRRLATAMGGLLELAAPPPEGGALFRLVLPAADPQT